MHSNLFPNFFLLNSIFFKCVISNLFCYFQSFFKIDLKSCANNSTWKVQLAFAKMLAKLTKPSTWALLFCQGQFVQACFASRRKLARTFHVDIIVLTGLVHGSFLRLYVKACKNLPRGHCCFDRAGLCKLFLALRESLQNAQKRLHEPTLAKQ